MQPSLLFYLVLTTKLGDPVKFHANQLNSHQIACQDKGDWASEHHIGSTHPVTNNSFRNYNKPPLPGPAQNLEAKAVVIYVCYSDQ